MEYKIFPIIENECEAAWALCDKYHKKTWLPYPIPFRYKEYGGYIWRMRAICNTFEECYKLLEHILKEPLPGVLI